MLFDNLVMHFHDQSHALREKKLHGLSPICYSNCCDEMSAHITSMDGKRCNEVNQISQNGLLKQNKKFWKEEKFRM